MSLREKYRTTSIVGIWIIKFISLIVVLWNTGKYLCFWEAHAEIYRNKKTQCKKAILKDSSSTHGQRWTLKPDGLNLAPNAEKEPTTKAVL